MVSESGNMNVWIHTMRRNYRLACISIWQLGKGSNSMHALILLFIFKPHAWTYSMHKFWHTFNICRYMVQAGGHLVWPPRALRAVNVSCDVCYAARLIFFCMVKSLACMQSWESCIHDRIYMHACMQLHGLKAAVYTVTCAVQYRIMSKEARHICMHNTMHAARYIMHACMHFLFSIRIQKMAKRRCHQVGPKTEMLEP